tara:strand:- start:315 stop:578 length:264 start_codon:yes stop_codon:yes gene_type:complete
MNNDIKNLKKKLIYRSQYRGTKEMDKLIGSFVENHIDRLNNYELEELEKFLELNDDTLYKLYNGQHNDSELNKSAIIKLFKSFKYKD